MIKEKFAVLNWHGLLRETYLSDRVDFSSMLIVLWHDMQKAMQFKRILNVECVPYRRLVAT